MIVDEVTWHKKKTEEEEEKKFNLQKIFWRTFPLYLYSYFLKYADGIGKKFIFFRSRRRHKLI